MLLLCVYTHLLFGYNVYSSRYVWNGFNFIISSLKDAIYFISLLSCNRICTCVHVVIIQLCVYNRLSISCKFNNIGTIVIGQLLFIVTYR